MSSHHEGNGAGNAGNRACNLANPRVPRLGFARRGVHTRIERSAPVTNLRLHALARYEPFKLTFRWLPVSSAHSLVTCAWAGGARASRCHVALATATAPLERCASTPETYSDASKPSSLVSRVDQLRPPSPARGRMTPPRARPGLKDASPDQVQSRPGQACCGRWVTITEVDLVCTIASHPQRETAALKITSTAVSLAADFLAAGFFGCGSSSDSASPGNRLAGGLRCRLLILAWGG